jgi:hypothetical protein
VRSDAKTETVRRALAWIVDALNRHRVPYQVVRGLAARAWRPSRPPRYRHVRPLRRSRGPARRGPTARGMGARALRRRQLDITFLKIDYRGQQIELGNSPTEPNFLTGRNGGGRSSGSPTSAQPLSRSSGSRWSSCQRMRLPVTSPPSVGRTTSPTSNKSPVDACFYLRGGRRPAGRQRVAEAVRAETTEWLRRSYARREWRATGLQGALFPFSVG